MISYAWQKQLDPRDRAEADALVEEAARYDQEAGFAAIGRTDVDSVSRPGETVWHLPVKARKDLSVAADAPLVMVAYLHLSIDTRGQGTIKYAVRPGYRARGVSTLLVEELGLDVQAPNGWCDTGATSLRCWAYGSHPASERLTRRVDVRPVARLWTLLRHLTGPFAAPIVQAPTPGGVMLEGPIDVQDTQAQDSVGRVLVRAGRTHTQFEQLIGDLAERQGQVLIASVSGRAVGFVWFDPELVEHLELRTAWIRALVVIPDVRDGGLGSLLASCALNELKSATAQLALMRVDPADHSAVRMSRLLSFEQEDAHACYQIGEWIDPPAFAAENL
ncbi:GNAT family N-acetyltransferase [Nocardia sp. NPDC004860]|uniref:GNAT family N-acetyltransferase n=1 Tax=Nocardia sp. NPDC004860 TaxID=3154557 RepID=UPI0033A5D2B9